MAYIEFVSATPINLPYPRPEFEGQNWVALLPQNMAATPVIPLPPPSPDRPEEDICILTVTWPILAITKGQASGIPQPIPIPDPSTMIVPVPVLDTEGTFDHRARLTATEAWRAHLSLAIESLDEEIRKLRDESEKSA